MALFFCDGEEDKILVVVFGGVENTKILYKLRKKFKKVLDNSLVLCHNQRTFQGGEGIKNLPNVLFLRVSSIWAEFPYRLGAVLLEISIKRSLKGFFIIYKG